MFSSNSRYAKIPAVEVETGKDKKATAVKLRRLPYVSGNPVELKGTDRLDIMAQRKYKDGTQFWHIADANTELEAAALVAQKTSENPLEKQAISVILVPES